MSTPFEDRGQTLFGRAPDLAFLLARAQHPGVTILRSRAQMGKTTLLLQLAHRLSATHLVGYTETSGQTTEPLRYAVQDLYARWLAASTLAEQAHVVTRQHKERWVEKLGETTGSLLTNLAKAAGKPLEAAAAAAKTLLDGLVQANQTLRTGGQQLPQLQIEQARDLLQMVADVTGRRLVIILDQWEKSLDLAAQLNLLELFLKHLDQWPACHIVVGTRDDQPLSQTLDQRIGRGFHEKDATLYDLPFMHLEQADDTARLLAHIRARHALTRTTPDDDLLSLIAGYPEVVNRWMHSDTIPSRDDLKRLANNAHRYLYPEFQQQLPELTASELRLVMRLALLPGAGDPPVWQSLKPILMEEVQLADCGKLGRRHLLDRPTPPSFGHAKRAEVALTTLLADFNPELVEACERLILRLAQEIHDSDHAFPFASSLVHLASFLTPLELSPAAQLLCYSACTLFGEHTPLQSALVKTARNTLSAEIVSVTSLVAMGVYNALNHASLENDLQRRDGLLQQLRELARNHPQDDAVREWMAKSLFNTLNLAQQENDRNRLLEELRELAHNHPQDDAVRKWLAKGLFNTLYHAEQENDCNRLIEELRELARNHPQDDAVREWMAKGLFNTLYHAEQENDRNRLLEELRILKRQYPDDAIWQQIAEYIDLDEEEP